MTPKVTRGLGPLREVHPFSSLLEGREDEFPILSLANRASEPATSYRIEWNAYVDGSNRLWTNFTQIWRHPYTEPVPQGSQGAGSVDSLEEAHGAALTKFLTSIEQTLLEGVPNYYLTDAGPVGTCGGVRHYLGRDLVIGDRIRLRPLQEPFLWTHEQDRFGVPLDHPTYEWLCETSLQVSP